MSDTTIEHDATNATCACPNCGGFNPDVKDASLDPLAGGTFNGKPIYSADQVAAHLNRTLSGWTDGFGDDSNSAAQSNIGNDNSVITFGFFNTQQEVRENGYVFVSASTGRLTGYSEFFNFAALSTAQREAAREMIQSWDDVVAVSFRRRWLRPSNARARIRPCDRHQPSGRLQCGSGSLHHLRRRCRICTGHPRLFDHVLLQWQLDRGHAA
jgi:hypothetical protein